jgi:hypothetical protein
MLRENFISGSTTKGESTDAHKGADYLVVSVKR